MGKLRLKVSEHLSSTQSALVLGEKKNISDESLSTGHNVTDNPCPPGDENSDGLTISLGSSCMRLFSKMRE